SRHQNQVSALGGRDAGELHAQPFRGAGDQRPLCRHLLPPSGAAARENGSVRPAFARATSGQWRRPWPRSGGKPPPQGAHGLVPARRICSLYVLGSPEQEAPMQGHADRYRTFRALHDQHGCFVVANAWDVGSARVLSALGFAALATTSAGYAFAAGKRDSSGTLSRAELLDNAATIAAATDLP